MKSDAEIRDDVIDELRWDPQITDPDAIGVAVQDGAVTLTGACAHLRARSSPPPVPLERVYGVKAVANELNVKLAGAPRDDSDIATGDRARSGEQRPDPRGQGTRPGAETAG